MSDQPSPRLSIVSAYKAVKASGGEPTQDELQRRLSGVSSSIIASTMHVLALAEASGRTTVSGIRQWQEERKAAGDLTADLAKGFSTASGHEILKAFAEREAIDPERYQPDAGDSHNDEGEAPRGSSQEGGGGAVARPEMLDVWRQWQESADSDRKAAAAEARRVEREIADAQLATERERLVMERTRAASQIVALQAHHRMVIMAVTLVALAVGSAGTWWALHHNVVLAPQEVHGAAVPPATAGAARDPVVTAPNAPVQPALKPNDPAGEGVHQDHPTSATAPAPAMTPPGGAQAQPPSSAP